MRLSKRQLKRIIREEYTFLKRKGLIRESRRESQQNFHRGEMDFAGDNPNDYIENMAMEGGYQDAMESSPGSANLSRAIADVRNFGNYEDLLMAPEDAIQGLIDQSDAVFELAMEATAGEGYDQMPLSDEWRGFLIGILAAA